MDEDIIISDSSQIHKTYVYIFATVAFCLAGYLFMTVRYIVNTGSLPVMDIITEILLTAALLMIWFDRTEYELHRDALTVRKISLFRTRTFHIPFDVIDGAFYFKVEPIKRIGYRHTYNVYGQLDRRDIWSLVYNIPETDHVSRLLMKASEEFWAAFEKLLPHRIRVEQETVLRHAFAHISGHPEADGSSDDVEKKDIKKQRKYECETDAPTIPEETHPQK